MKIIIIRFSSLGDVVILSSLFETIYREVKDAEITFVTKGIYQPLYDFDPRLSEIITYPGESVFEIGRIIRRKRYDVRIDAHRSLRSFIVRKIGGGKWRLYENLRRKRREKVRSGNKEPLTPLYIRYNNTVKDIVRRVNYKPVLHTTGEGENILGRYNIDRPPLIFVPFASRKGKEWEPSHYAELGKKAVKEGIPVLIFGSREERKRAEEIRGMVGKGCYNFAGVFDLDEMKEIMKCAFGVVGGDTGLLHISDALGVRCVFIYTSTHPSLGFAPTRLTSQILSSELECQPCHIHGAVKCKTKNFRCLRIIPPEEVWRKIIS